LKAEKQLKFEKYNTPRRQCVCAQSSSYFVATHRTES